VTSLPEEPDVHRRADFENPTSDSASLPEPQNLKFERDDWSLFRTVEGLQQKAGVAKDKLPRLVLKELADNGLDENATTVRTGELPKGGWFVEDDGPGIDGTPGDIARLFSIARPMLSSKLLRLPTRGTLGNGLRVVAGAVLASGGSLNVTTRNRRIVLRPERDGSSTVVSSKPVKFPIGTRIEIGFGSALPCDDDTPLYWADTACCLAGSGSSYSGKSSPWWYDAPQFHELLYASGSTPVRELISHLDGCTGAKAGEIVAQARLGRALCKDVTRQQAERLLVAARKSARRVAPARLGGVGQEAFPDHAYACAYGLARFGADEPHAEIPFIVEAWAEETDIDADTDLSVCVNRTPITGDIRAARDKRDIDFYGCGLHHNITQAPKDAQFSIWLNLTTPYMPITSDGKAPDLEPFFDEIRAAVGKAVKKAHRPNARGSSQKDVVLDNLDAVIADVSGDGEFRFNMRQLFYGLRPIDQGGAAPGAAAQQFHRHHHRLRERERRDRGDVPRAAWQHHSPAPRRDHHARHAHGRGVRAAGVDLQQVGFHREGGRQRGVESGALAGTP
jgi:hypothetical protein